MLAHKATHEGKVAAEVISGDKSSSFDPKAIPAVIFTDPEIAWAGPTEAELKRDGIPFVKGEFPWKASGRAISLDHTEGKTKILADPKTNTVIGIGIVGTNAGDLIGEGMLAIEMGADAEDIGLTIHPHPSLSETVANAAEIIEGTITDLYIPRSK
jgi:dihydrolipoamide dehydrogenase